MEYSIDLIPSLQLMAVEIILNCCRRTSCRQCQLNTDGRCFFDDFSQRQKFPKKLVDN